MDRSALVNCLKSLDDVELVRVFYEVVVPRRSEYVVEDDGRKVVDHALVLAEVGFVDAGDDSASTEVIAIPPSHYVSKSNDSLCQSGRCTKCRSLVTGFTKVGICPVCLNDVKMT